MEQTTINLLLGLVRSSGAGVDVKLMVGSAICPHAFAYLFLDMATLEVSELLELITQPSCIQMFSAFVFFVFFPLYQFPPTKLEVWPIASNFKSSPHSKTF
jgi:hypothetical protein